MKLLPLLLFLLLAAAAQAQRPASSPPPAYETRQRIVFCADFTGAPGVDDLLVIDRSSGTYIVGSPGASPGFVWTEPANLGVAPVDAAALAHFVDSDAWSLAVTYQLFNRVQYVPLDGSEPPASVSPGEILPFTLVGFETGGADVTSSFVAGFVKSGSLTPALIATHPGGLPPANFNATLWRNSGAGANPRGGQPVYLNPAFAAVTAFLADATSGSDSRLQFFTAGPSSSTLIATYNGLPEDAQFTVGHFEADLINIYDDSLRSATALAWSPSDNLLRSVRLTDQDNFGVLDLITVGSYNLGRPIQSVRIIEEAVPRLLVAWADAAGGASLYDYDGRNAPVLVGPVDMNGMDLDDAIPTSGGDFILIGKRGGSLAYDRLHRSSGNTYTRTATGSIPTAPSKPLYSNIIAFNGEPFVNAFAKPVSRKRVPDWTTSPAFSTGTITLSALLDGGTTAGLGNAQPTLVSAPGGTTHALANQIDPSTSITLLDAGIAANQTAADVAFSPGSGRYAGPLTVTIQTRPANLILHYQVGDGDWQRATGDTLVLELAADSFVRAYATSFAISFGGSPYNTGGSGRIRSASYTIATPAFPQAAANADVNHNGLSDAWEALTGLIDPGGDADNDGFLNLQEHNFGTDPGSASSNPGIIAQPMHLNLVDTLGPAASTTLEWAASDTAVILEGSDDLNAWQPVTENITTSSGRNHFTMPVGTAARKFYRLRR